MPTPNLDLERHSLLCPAIVDTAREELWEQVVLPFQTRGAPQ